MTTPTPLDLANAGPGATEATEPADSGTPATPEPENGNQGLVEARDRYRTERDSAREALTTLTQRVERLLRAEVERLAADGLSHPADLFSLSGNELADYLTDDGDVDPERVAADVAAILAERPGMRRPSPAYDPTQGHGSDVPARRPTMHDLLRS